MKKINKIFSYIMFGAAAFCLLYFLICILFGGGHLSIIYAWPFCAAVFSFVGGVSYIAVKYQKAFLSALGIFVNLVAIGFVVSFFVFAVNLGITASEEPKENSKYIIVLGAAVNYDTPSRTLSYRIDAAEEYLKKNPETRVICTGGTGDDGDIISEGKCVADELKKRGIEESRILFEEMSTSTEENFEFALRLIEGDAESIVIVSSDFHLHRAKQILETKIDAIISTLPAKSDFFILHYTLREYIIKFIGEY